MKDTNKKGVVSPKLPKSIKVSIYDLLDELEAEELNEKINDYLSDTYGFCVYGYNVKDLEIVDIDWDTKE